MAQRFLSRHVSHATEIADPLGLYVFKEQFRNMNNSKLIELLSAFDKREWRRFEEFLESPYFNKAAEMIHLAKRVKTAIETKEGMNKKSLFESFSNGADLSDKKMNHLLSQLLKLAEQFLGIEQVQKEGTTQFVLTALDHKALSKHYNFLFEKERSRLQATKVRDASLQLKIYQMENLEANRISRTSVRKYNPHVQQTADALDRFYLMEKLRCTCYMLTSQLVLATSYNLELVSELERFLDSNPIPEDAVVLQAYHRIFKMLTREDADSDFEGLSGLLFNSPELFRDGELAELFQYAINFCNLRIMKGEEVYVQRALDLYIAGVEQGILLDQGKLSPWHYKNIIKLALRSKRYEWTEGFIKTHTQLMDPVYRQDAYNFNLAELYYYTNRYDLAMDQLNRVEFTDVHYNLGAKVMLAKIYFENEAQDALESLLHAFKTYLHRNKLISNDLRRTYLNFIRTLQQVQKVVPEKRDGLKQKVETMRLITEKNWLLRMI